MRQITFACQPSFEKYAGAGRREQFLNTMEAVVPWAELEALIERIVPRRATFNYPQLWKARVYVDGTDSVSSEILFGDAVGH